MFTQLFADFLLKKKLVEPEKLQYALDFQQSFHLKLGVLAINAGYMTAEQVEEVHKKQTLMDKKFGNLAIEMNYLTQEKLDFLLNTQKYGHLLLGQALIDEGYMTLEEFENSLLMYKKDFSLTDEQFNELQKSNAEQIVDIYCNLTGSKSKDIYKIYLSLLVRNLVRFLDIDIRIDTSQKIETHKCNWLCSQEIFDRTGLYLYTGISSSNTDTFIGFNKKLAGKDLLTIEEFGRSSIGEFLSLQNRTLLGNISNSGIEFDLRPLDIVFDKTLINLSDAYIVPIITYFGSFNLIISKTKPNIL